MSSKKPYRVEHIFDEILLYYREDVPIEDVIEYCNETFEDYSNMNISFIHLSPEITNENRD